MLPFHLLSVGSMDTNKTSHNHLPGGGPQAPQGGAGGLFKPMAFVNLFSPLGCGFEGQNERCKKENSWKQKSSYSLALRKSGLIFKKDQNYLSET